MNQLLPGDQTSDAVRQGAKQFRSDVVAGLRAIPKQLPCKYFYDRRGSELFEQICRLEEYYPTRTELAITRRYAAQMADAIGNGAMLVEFGSGASTKTRLLLDELAEAAYVPVDVSRQFLRDTAIKLARRYPALEVHPVCADFTGDFGLPGGRAERRVVYFPGSTIGNFEPQEAAELLQRIAKLTAPDGGLLIGVDLQKDVAVLEAAYNDSEGVTAQFNRNLLVRINRELEGDFDLNRFEHQAFYCSSQERIEMHLVSLGDQTAAVGGDSFKFLAAESIRTELSHKYTIEGFEKIAKPAGLRLRRAWTDPRNYFAVLYFDA